MIMELFYFVDDFDFLDGFFSDETSFLFPNCFFTASAAFSAAPLYRATNAGTLNLKNETPNISHF
jgi:hypothetical protein